MTSHGNMPVSLLPAPLAADSVGQPDDERRGRLESFYFAFGDVDV
jgi:hypothetical protein